MSLTAAIRQRNLSELLIEYVYTCIGTNEKSRKKKSTTKKIKDIEAKSTCRLKKMPIFFKEKSCVSDRRYTVIHNACCKLEKLK